MPAAGASIEAIGDCNGIAALVQNTRGGVIARTGVGTYTLTLDRALNALDGAIFCTDDSGVALPSIAAFNIVHTTDVVKTITRIVFANGAAYAQPAAADGAFDVMAVRWSDCTG